MYARICIVLFATLLLAGCEASDDRATLLQSTVARGQDGQCYLIESYERTTVISKVDAQFCSHLRDGEGDPIQ